jgi:hypothetical protein
MPKATRERRLHRVAAVPAARKGGAGAGAIGEAAARASAAAAAGAAAAAAAATAAEAFMPVARAGSEGVVVRTGAQGPSAAHTNAVAQIERAIAAHAANANHKAHAAAGRPAPKMGVKQRREERRARFLEQLKSTSRAITQVKTVRKVGLALGSVSQLSDALLSSVAEEQVEAASKAAAREPPAAPRGLSNKRRTKLQHEEVAFLSQVLAHPAVKQNACQAIQEHLRNTRAIEKQHEQQQDEQHQLKRKHEQLDQRHAQHEPGQRLFGQHHPPATHLQQQNQQRKQQQNQQRRPRR